MSPADATRPRAVRVGVFRHPDGGSVVTSPRGTLFRLKVDPAEVDALIRSCDGTRTLPQLASEFPAADYLDRFVARLSAEGGLTTRPPSPGEADWARLGGATTDFRPETHDLVVCGSQHLVDLFVDARAGAAFGSVRAARSSEDLERAAGPAAVAVALLDVFSGDALTEVLETCARHDIPASYFYFEGERGWFGPHVRSGQDPTVHDLIARRTAAARDPGAVRALEQPATPKSRYLPPRDELAWMLASFIVDFRRWLSGVPSLARWHQVELDPVAFTTDRHPVLPLPNSDVYACATPELVGDPADLLVDERTGIIVRTRDVTHPPSVPTALTTVHADVSKINRVLPWRNDPIAGGSAFLNRGSATNAAIGEAVERYCGNVIQPSLLTRATYEELTASGEKAVDPASLVLYSSEQHATPGFPFVEMGRDLRIHWVRGRCLTTQESAWLPATLVYANWYAGDYSDDPKTNPTYFPGLAAGRDLDSAVVAGLQEVIERHATMVWWASARALPALREPVPIRDLWRGVPSSVRRWAIPVDNEFDVPVFAGFVEDRESRLLTVGFAARSNPHDALRKSWAEALTLQDIARDLHNPDGAYWKAGRQGLLNSTTLKQWREDRRYLDSYRTDFRDVTDLMCQLQVNLDPRAQERYRPWIDVDAGRTIDGLPMLADSTLRTYQEVVENRGFEIYYVDITTPDVRKAGLRVARTIVPGLVPNFATGFPYLGRHALQRSMVALGWRSEESLHDDLNLFPMPHA